MELRARSGPPIALSQVAKAAMSALATGAAARRAPPAEESPAAAALHAAFSCTFTTIFDVHSRIAADHEAAGGAAEPCMSNADIALSLDAFKSLHAAMDARALGYLFQNVQTEVMDSFLNACAAQARAGVGARHATLHDEVRPTLRSAPQALSDTDTLDARSGGAPLSRTQLSECWRASQLFSVQKNVVTCTLHMQMTTRPAMTTLAALEAARVLLMLMASPACPRVLFQAQLVETVCQLMASQLECNLLAFCDASVRRDCRLDWEHMAPLAKCASRCPPLLASYFVVPRTASSALLDDDA